MKKLFILVAVCGLAFGTATSCKKDRSCKCESTIEGVPNVDQSLGKGKKGDQETACKAMETGGMYKNCKLD